MPPSSTPSDPDRLLATVQQTLAAHHMLVPGDRVLVGVSGGPDSMALLHLLSRLAPELKIRLGVAHLNHCLRGRSADRDAGAVNRAAAALNIPCHMGRARVMKVKRKLGLSLEEAGRRVRYAFFNKTMADAGYSKLALGHHLDDNAEQMLMALLRGTGPRGLSGIAPVRGKRIIRPLINARRAQIDEFVCREEISCVSDSSNHDLRFVRNRIRHRLLPLLADQYNPRIADHLTRLADVTRNEEEWVDTLVAVDYQRAVLAREKDAMTLSVGTLRVAHPALARRLLRMALEDLTGTLRQITFTHVQAVLGLLGEGCNGKACHLPGGIRARRTGDRLVLEKRSGGRWSAPEPPVEAKGISATLISTPPPGIVEIQAMRIGLRFFSCRPDQLPRWKDVAPSRAYFDLSRLAFPLTVRPAAPGDRFTPLGASGSQKLKKFFIDHRVPRQNRTNAPVLADKKRIIWLMGHRMDEHVKVTEETSQVLAVEFFLLDTR
jgi:tRNA(Ile)-lysidine synthase